MKEKDKAVDWNGRSEGKGQKGKKYAKMKGKIKGIQGEKRKEKWHLRKI